MPSGPSCGPANVWCSGRGPRSRLRCSRPRSPPVPSPRDTWTPSGRRCAGSGQINRSSSSRMRTGWWRQPRRRRSRTSRGPCVARSPAWLRTPRSTGWPVNDGRLESGPGWTRPMACGACTAGSTRTPGGGCTTASMVRWPRCSPRPRPTPARTIPARSRITSEPWPWRRSSSAPCPAAPAGPRRWWSSTSRRRPGRRSTGGFRSNFRGVCWRICSGRPTPASSWSATVSCCTRPANSTSDGRPVWPARPSGGRCGRCTPRAPSRAAGSGSGTHSRTTSPGGSREGRLTSRTCSRCVTGTTTACTTKGWRLRLGAGRDLVVVLPDGQVMTTGPPQRQAA